jgi:hypothetical protein
MSGFDVLILTGKRELKRLPQHVTRAIVKTRSNFEPPDGWQEVAGAMHAGKGVWFIPVERVKGEGPTDS